MKKLNISWLSLPVLFLIIVTNHQFCWGAFSNKSIISIKNIKNPVIEAIAPDNCLEGANDIKILGKNFVNVQQVTIWEESGSKALANTKFSVNSSTQITTQVDLLPGKYFIIVTTKYGMSNKSPLLTVNDGKNEVQPILKFKMNLTSPQNNSQNISLDTFFDRALEIPAQVSYEVRASNTGRLDSGVLKFETGVTQKVFTLNVTNHQLNNLAEDLRINLYDSVNVDLETDNLLVVNVKDPRFGGRGDGLTLDREAVQRALDYLFGHGEGVLYFPKGVYPIYQVYLPWGVTLLGEGTLEAVLKAPDRVHTLIGSNFWRMFRTVTGKYKYSGNQDSPPLRFHNLVVDYNGPQQIGWNDGYNAEQNFCLELGGYDTTNPGRLKFEMDNCEVRHSVTDGLSIIANVDVTVTNTVFKTNRRGSLCILGGHSVTRAKGIKILNDLGIYAIALQSEPCIKGFQMDGKGPLYFELNVENAEVEGQIDLGNQAYDRLGAGTLVHFRNVQAPKGDLLITNGSGGKMIFDQCTFGQLGTHYFLMPHDLTFNDCTFIMRRKWWDGTWPEACVRLAWNQGGTMWQEQVLTFNNCTFTAEESTADAPHYTSAVKIVLWESFDNNNKVIFNGGIVTDKLKCVIDSNYGGMATMVFKDLTSYANAASFRLSGGDGSGRYHAVFDNVKVLSGKFATLCRVGSECKLTFVNLSLDNQFNWLSCASQQLEFTLPTIEGTRIIWGDEPPTHTHGLPGDIFRLKSNPSQTWVCTKVGFLNEYNKVNYWANWQAK